MTARGFIETQGLLAAIGAADAMLKAADVRLIKKSLVGGGLVTIIVGGEVSAVRAAVDTAIVAVNRIDKAALISEHVIARPYEEVSQLIATKEAEVPVAELKKQACEVQEDILEHHQPAEKGPQPAVTEVSKVQVEATKKHYIFSELQKTTVSKLRQISRGLGGISLTEQEIKTATKKKLIEAIINATHT